MTFHFTDQQIYENRKLVIDFLKQPERKKVTSRLDAGGDYRCCLGHMCFALIERLNLNVTLSGPEYCEPQIHYNGEANTLPDVVIAALGMHNRLGGTLNEDKTVSP